MDRNGGVDGDRAVLQRIVALLFALAVLADRASSRSRAVCLFVLNILRQAEAVAQECLIGTARDFGAPMPVQAQLAIQASTSADGGDHSAEAARLAGRFRALALALAYLLMLVECFDGPVAAGALGGVLNEPDLRSGWRVRPVQAPDTS